MIWWSSRADTNNNSQKFAREITKALEGEVDFPVQAFALVALDKNGATTTHAFDALGDRLRLTSDQWNSMQLAVRLI